MIGAVIVHKFGGTSLAGASRLRRAAGIVLRTESLFPGAGNPAGSPQVVVVSALAGVTDTLIQAARAAAAQDEAVRNSAVRWLADAHRQIAADLFGEGPTGAALAGWIDLQIGELQLLLDGIHTLGELTPRTRDRVMSFGEALSARILADLLGEGGCPSIPVSAVELVVTDEGFGHARPLWEETTQRVKAILVPLLARGVTPVVTGFIGATKSGVPTTLGRGGSDYSAAILGSCLDASAVWIWSDVNGILTADPNLEPEAKPLCELSYGEAELLAAYGADVLHPKTIRPLVEKGIPLRLLNSFFPADEGTRIVLAASPERELPPAIISMGGLSLLTLDGDESRPQLAWSARILGALHAAGLEVPMFSRSFADHRLNLFIRQPDLELCLHTIQQCLDGQSRLELMQEVAMISIVGFQPAAGETGIRSGLSALGRSGARLIALVQAPQGHVISVCLPEDQLQETVRHLHRELRAASQTSPAVQRASLAA